MPAVCDCFPELKSVTDAREARYRADPDQRAPEGPQSSLEIKVTPSLYINGQPVDPKDKNPEGVRAAINAVLAGKPHA